MNGLFRSDGHGHAPPLFDRQSAIRWGAFIALVFFVKGVLLLLDHRPMFFMADSMAYINTSLHGKIPPDRSFTYGYIIRAVALWPRSLGLLVAFQSLLGAMTSILSAFILRKFFRASSAVAFAIGLLNAVEPLQLMYERYVLTEAVALFFFALYVALVFQYIARRRTLTLVLLQVAAILLISIRFSFMPLVFITTCLIPVLAAWGPMAAANRMKVVATAVHLTLSIALFGILITGYKHLNAHLSNRPPAIHYASGHFLLAGLVPIVTPQDFPHPEIRDAVFGSLTRDLTDRRDREFHRWKEGGLVRSIKDAVPGMTEADRVSKQTAMNALKRDPPGAARLILLTYADHFNFRYLKSCMNLERGLFKLPPWFLKKLQDHFRYRYDPAAGVHIKTLTGRIFFRAWPWYVLLVLLPVPALFALFIGPRASFRYTLALLLFTLLLLGPLCLIGPRPVVRFLHPLAWIALLIGGIFAQHCRRGLSEE